MKLATYGLIGKLGNLEPLRPIPRDPVVKSFHVIDMDSPSLDDPDAEVAIAYDRAYADEICEKNQAYGIIVKPIFRQFPIAGN